MHTGPGRVLNPTLPALLFYTLREGPIFFKRNRGHLSSVRTGDAFFGRCVATCLSSPVPAALLDAAATMASLRCVCVCVCRCGGKGDKYCPSAAPFSVQLLNDVFIGRLFYNKFTYNAFAWMPGFPYSGNAYCLVEEGKRRRIVCCVSAPL